MRAGEKIVIFPEGTYFRHEVGSGKSRLLQMILRFQTELGNPIPFIPVGIRYGEEVRLEKTGGSMHRSPSFCSGESDAFP